MPNSIKNTVFMGEIRVPIFLLRRDKSHNFVKFVTMGL